VEVRTVYPSPVTRRSASCRLCFCFVRVVRDVRAGEAKLRGRMTSDVPVAGPRVLGSTGVREVFRIVFVDSFIKMDGFCCLLLPRVVFLLLFIWF